MPLGGELQCTFNYCAVHYYTARAPFVVLFYLKRLVFEQVQHCLGAPLYWGPGTNCPCCPLLSAALAHGSMTLKEYITRVLLCKCAVEVSTPVSQDEVDLYHYPPVCTDTIPLFGAW